MSIDQRNVRAALGAVILFAAACSAPPPATDASVDAPDASAVDAATDRDSGAIDSGIALEDAGHDAGPLDGGAARDAGALLDAGGDTDGGPIDPCGCAAGTACLRGVCIATCGADLARLDAALAPDVEVVRHYCETPAAMTTHDGSVIQVDATHRVGDGVLAITVGTWEPGAAPMPMVRSIATAEWLDDDARLSVDDIVLDASGQIALVHASARGASSFGALARVDLAGGRVLETDSVERLRNPVLVGTDAWVEQLSAQIVRRGTGRGVVAQLTPTSSFLSGDMAVWSEAGLVVAGFARRSGLSAADPTVYFVPLEAATGAAAALDLATDAAVLRSTELPYDTFTLLPGGRLVDRADFADVGVRTLTRTATGIELGERQTIATSTDVLWRVLALGDELLLPHAAGVLRVRLR